MTRHRHSPISSRMRRGFTMIELVAASALAAVLMMVCFHVIRAVGIHGNAGQAAQGKDSPQLSDQWKSEVTDLLRWDLLEAQGMSQRGGSLLLVGYGSLDRNTRQPTHRPVLVQYSIQTVGSLHWLLRRQTSLDDHSDQRTWSDVVCWDVATLELTPLPTQAELDAAAETARMARVFGVNTRQQEASPPAFFESIPGVNAMPACLHVTIRANEEMRPIVDSTFLLR